jgi:hypothetical protein
VSLNLGSQLLKWTLIGVGLLIVGIAFALVNIARAEYQDQYPILETRWIGVVLFTILVFGFVASVFRASWKRTSFWMWLGVMLMGHMVAYAVVLTKVVEWRAVWFVLVTLVEGPVLIYWLEERGYRRR